MKTLDLALKTQWYDAIAKGKKKVEYRDMRNLYYTNKLLNVDGYLGKTAEEVRDGLLNGSIKTLKLAGWTHVRFHNLGRSMIVEIRGIRVDRDNKVFAIDLGKLLSGARPE